MERSHSSGGVYSTGHSRAAQSFIRRRRAIRFSARTERPAAMAWPPKRRSRSAQEAMHSCRLKPCTLRPLPLPSPFSSMETTMTGRPVFSTRREATMPMTPGCQFCPQSRMTRSSKRPGSRSSSSCAALTISCSVSCRETLISVSRWASSAARSSSSQRTSCRAVTALSIRPAALRRGAMA